MNPADQIVLRLALSDPTEMIDPNEPEEWACFFCGGDHQGSTSAFFHASDCLWVEACRYTGTDLGAHGVAE